MAQRVDFGRLRPRDFRLAGAGPSAGETSVPSAPPDATVVSVPDPAELEAAYRRGLEEGLRQGREEGAATLESVRAEATRHAGLLGEALAAAQQEIARRQEEALLALVNEALSKILAQTPRNPESVVAVVRDAVAHAGSHRVLAISLHPDDHDLLHECGGPTVQSWIAGLNAEIRPDPAVAPGGCRVETDFGSVDAELATKLAELRGILCE